MSSHVLSTLVLSASVASLGLSSPVQAEDGNLTPIQKKAVVWLQEYLQVDTTNPPGHESRAVEYFAKILQAHGISYEMAEKAPGRGNLWARLPGGDEPAIILLNHTDVVPANAEFWSVPAFSGELRDGHIYGRGALDMKSIGILQLAACLALHEAERPLNRDVIFMATADEESGGSFGAGWLVEHHAKLFAEVGYVLTEGGGGYIVDGKAVFEIELTQKTPLWIRLVAKGEPGHGSAPRAKSAVKRLIKAVSRIQTYEFSPHITPEVARQFKHLSPHVPEEWRAGYSNLREAVRDPDFLRRLQNHDRWAHALTRNTCSVTRLKASDKINVVPPEASAELDCRLLPDQDAEEFLDTLRSVISDTSISIKVLMESEPAVSTADTKLYRAIQRVSQHHFPDTPIVPAVGTGFTDSRFLRAKGVVCYGYAPFLIPVEDLTGIHGNDERISVENMTRGVHVMVEILEEFVY